MDALLGAQELSQWAGRRDHALLLTLYNTGARVSEMTGASKDSSSLWNQDLCAVQGQGTKGAMRFLCGPRQAALCEHGLRNWIPTLDIKYRQPSPMLAAWP